MAASTLVLQDLENGGNKQYESPNEEAHNNDDYFLFSH
jgi:hypothetical protein